MQPDLTEARKPLSIVSDSDVGILVIHGITSTPGSMAYVVERLAAEGWNVECPLLPGHGTRWEDMDPYRWRDWTEFLQGELGKLRKRCSKVFVSGLSLGGGLAVWLAENEPDLKGLILYNHLMVLKGVMVSLAPVAKYFLRSVAGVCNDIKEPGVIEPAYQRVNAKAAVETIALAKEIRSHLGRISIPTIIFKSREDHVLLPECATVTFEGIASKDKELVWLDNSYHVLTMDYDKVIALDRTIEFIRRTS